MTAKLFIALYVGLFVGMFILFFTNFAVAWVFFAFVFVTVFGGIWFINRPPLIAGAFLVPSLIVLGVGLSGILRLREIAAWPTAPGVITRSWNCSRVTNGSVTYTGPCIEYTYQVDEVKYNADTTDTGEFPTFSWPPPVDRFRPNQSVRVYHDPLNPGISRLAADSSSIDWSAIGIGGIMAVLAAFTLFWTLFGPKGTKRTAQADPVIHFADAHPAPPPDRPSPHRDSALPPLADIGDQLEKLIELRKANELTEEEYAAAKKKLLGLP